MTTPAPFKPGLIDNRTASLSERYARSEGLGALVRGMDERGIGKLIALDGGRATVEYFFGPSRRTRIQSQAETLTPVRLAPQTRCYVYDRVEERWIAGRIGERDAQEYEVNFPDKQSAWIHRGCLYVRAGRRNWQEELTDPEDPTDALVLKAHETAYFHTRRSALVRALIRQRAGVRGVTALSSARIDLYPHQVEVVRRVLADPRQRYLLADEVGLGKTIEAGVLIRQFLLDVPADSALVVVPPMLHEQWSHELAERVDVLHSGRVVLASTDDLPSLRVPRKLGLFVLDEAHHVAGAAFAEEPGDRAKFLACQRIAHQTDRVLLLSATPAANHEAQFLAMLHLLEPSTYRLDDVAGFEARIRDRQDLGKQLRALRERAHYVPLGLTLNKLAQLFAADHVLAAQIQEIRNVISAAPGDIEARARLVRTLRTHVSETYRLHRRMIRNRREVLTDAVVHRSHALQYVHRDVSDETRAVEEALESWRALAALYAASDEFRTDESRRDFLVRIGCLLCAAADGAPELLAAAVAYRAGRPVDRDGRVMLEEEWPVEALRTIQGLPLLPDEEAALIRLEAAALAQADTQPRLAVLLGVLRDVRERAGTTAVPKCVVFCSSSHIAGRVADGVARQFGRRSIARHLRGAGRDVTEAEVQRFLTSRDCWVLVCDRSAEEGRNFQAAHHLVHYDLPWDPNRLEQRIGRLDRIGRTRDLVLHTLLGSGDPQDAQDAWYTLLENGFGIHTASIASFQFYVDRNLGRLQRVTILDGATALRDEASAVRAGLEEERERLADQAAIDEIDAADDQAREQLEALEKAEEQEDNLRGAFDDWLCGAMHFEREPSSANPKVVRYRTSRHTLVPEDVLQSRFRAYLSRASTFSRTVAGREPNTALLRLGDGFVDSVAEYIDWDDRGRAFAYWRYVPGWDARVGSEHVVFQFTFVVSADTLSARRAVLATVSDFSLSLDAIDRRADALCPPRVMTLYVDSAFREITDESLLKLLRTPFRKRAQGGNDTNLTKNRVSLIDLVIPPEEWASSCRLAREAAESHLRQRSSFRERQEALAAAAERSFELRLEQLEARVRRERADRESLGIAATENASSENELELERALASVMVAGVAMPRIRIDSVGLVVLSGRDLAVPQAGGEFVVPKPLAGTSRSRERGE